MLFSRMSAVLFFSLFLSSCVNPYMKMYKPFDSGRSDLIPCPAPEIKPTNVEPPQLQYDMFKKGYVIIGYSEFNSGEVSESDLLKQATQVQACVALLMKRFTHTQQNYMPIMQYNEGQQISINTQGTYTRSHASDVNYKGTSTVTTPGSVSTTYVPFTEIRHDYFATFWQKLPPAGIGLLFENIPDETRRKMNLEKGCIVKAVCEDSPADKAGFIPEDIIVACNGAPVGNAKEFAKIIHSPDVRTLELEVLRNGNPLKKTVQMAPDS